MIRFVRTTSRRFAAVVTTLSGLAACGGDATGPDGDTRSDAEIVLQHVAVDIAAPANYALPAYPVHYGPPVLDRDNTPADNSVTDEGATLGRVLFYDRELSLNRTVSCASCHLQASAFSDPRVLSRGFEGGETGSHSMRLANARFYEGDDMFWDRRARDVEDQALQPVFDATEMGFTDEAGGLTALVERLSGLEYYPILFEWAFGTPDVTEDRMRRALAQYVRSIVSTGSRFDDALAQLPPGPPQGDLPGLTSEENLGFRIFTRPRNQGGVGCAECHQLPTMALAVNSLSNGLDAGETTVFKAPSLKNVAVGGPFMHDGRFTTLEDVVRHYSGGIRNGPVLDRRLLAANGQPIRPNFTDGEVAALVAFMETLTDTQLLVDPRFSDPFAR